MSKRHNYNTRHKRKNTQPHASYYVGYVEDGETVESIMKKFEVLESIKQKKKEEIQAKENENKNNDEKEDPKISKKSSKAEITDSEGESDDDDGNNNNKKKDLDMEDENGNVLDEDELAQLFTETSLFSVRSAVNNNEIFMDKPIMDDDGFVTGYDTNVLNSELILAADYKDINDELMEDGDNNGGFEEYDPFEDDDANDPELFFEDIVGKKNKKDGSSSSARIGGAGGTRRRSRSTRGIRNAPQTAGGGARGEGGVNNTELMKDIDKHYAYTYGRLTAPADGDTDAAKKERALKLRTCAAMYCLKIPKYPMPQSWGHRIRRFNGHLESIGTDMERAKKELIGYDYIIHNDLKNLKKEDLPHGKYHAILMDAPWDVSCSVFDPRKGLLVPEQLTNLPISDLMENGMLFIWVPSELLVPIVRMIECDWGFRYVEHASYCKRTINNKFCISNSGFMNHSKENLLLFRKGDRKDYAGKLELRHQRTSDTHINFQRFHSKYSQMELKPSEFAYKMIETMLPDSTQQIRDAIKNKCDLSKVESRLLYLWAPEYEKRGGWTMMVDQKHLDYLTKQENEHVLKSNKQHNDKQNNNNNNKNNNNNENNGKKANGFENDKKENRMGKDSDDDDFMMMR